MRTANVIVVPYDTVWKSAFEDIKREIENALGDLIIGIQHVGSTSVEGLSAKPCIDLDVIIKDYTVFDLVVQKLADIGYVHEGDLGIKDREAFRYTDKPHLYKHHLYVCPQYSRELHRHITFRDFLRSNPEALKAYAKVKETAARLYPYDIDKYIAYKSPCIAELYKLCGLEESLEATEIKAVIFDMYETLVTQFESPLYYGTQIAQDLELEPDTFLPDWRKTEESRATGKRTFEQAMEELMKNHGIYTHERHQQVVDKRIAIQSDCFHHLHPGIIPMLSFLKNRGIKIGLISNCFSEETTLIRQRKWFSYFDAPCLSWEIGMRKPDPVIYHACTDLLGIPAENCLYVGDGGSQELETARSLGMQAVQATWYRKPGFEKYQATIRSDFRQIYAPMDLLRIFFENT